MIFRLVFPFRIFLNDTVFYLRFKRLRTPLLLLCKFTTYGVPLKSSIKYLTQGLGLGYMGWLKLCDKVFS